MREVRFRSKRVVKELDRLQEGDYQRVITRLKILSENPRPKGCEKLANDIYRVRVGDIRIIYLIDELSKRIDIGGVRRPSEGTYKEIESLFR